MHTLTRRRSHDSHRETWVVFYGDVPAGTIAERAGVPADLEQWGWTCGFAPALNRLLPTLTEHTFETYRQDRDFRAEIRAKRERGERLTRKSRTR